MRADLFLVAQGYAKSREQARAAIKAGLVSADGKPVLKPSQPLSEGMGVVYAPEHSYVSRGALKLIAALDHFALSPKGRVTLDLGASTGGFTQVLLERGALKVHAVEVGHGQMAKALVADPRVILHEGLNARNLTGASLGDAVSALAADLSFISLKLALPPALALAAKGAWAVLLVKPQFEVGREALGKGGIVRDRQARERALEGAKAFLAEEGWRLLGAMESPIRGGDGNIEYLLAAVKP